MSISPTHQPPLDDLPNTTLAEYIRDDTRPVFALDLAQTENADLTSAIVLSNAAFQASSAHLELCSNDRVSDQHREATGAFLHWLRNPHSQCTRFGNLVWSATTVRNRWRIASGIRIEECGGSVQSLSNGYLQARVDKTHAGVMNGHHALPRGGENLPIQMRLHPDLSRPHHRLLQEIDWAGTPLGGIDTWCPALKQQVEFMLSNPSPGSIFWGPERIMIYNEAFVPLIGSWHPRLLGQSLKVIWSDFWDHYEAICLEVEVTTRAVSKVAEDGPIFEHNGHLCETFFTFHYIPVFDDDGRIGGIYDQAVDVTRDTIAQGRMAALLRLSDVATRPTTQRGLWESTLATLQSYPRDVPFATVFAIGEDMSLAAIDAEEDHTRFVAQWKAQGSTRPSDDRKILLDEWNSVDPTGFADIMRQAIAKPDPTIINANTNSTLAALLAAGEYNGYKYSNIVICPLRLSSGVACGSLVLVTNPLRPYDDDYQHFVQVMDRQIEDALRLVLFIEAQAKRLQDAVTKAALEQQILSLELEKQTRKAEESALRFLRFADQAPVGVYVLGADGQVEYCNDTWYKLIGASREKGTEEKMIWLPTVHPDDREEVQRQWQYLVDGRPQQLFEWRVVRQPPTGDEDKDLTYLRSSCFPERTADGKLKSVTGILIDRTIEVAHERVTNARIAAALEEKRAQEYFMDMVSHEMRNPLNAMIQCAEEAADLLGDISKSHTTSPAQLDTLANTTATINTILYCGRHQKQIIDDVLTLSKLNSNLLTICPVPSCPETVVRQALTMFQSDMRAAGIQLSVDIAPSALLIPNRDNMLMDPGRILQVLINLIGNAVKFMKGRSERRLRVSLDAGSSRHPAPGIKYIGSGRERNKPGELSPDRRDSDAVFVHFSVQDTGPGLTETEQDALFARFQQGSPRTHSQYGGSGLGLFISRELTELHGGEIGVASEVGRGSTFAFYVQAHQRPETPSQEKAEGVAGAAVSLAPPTGDIIPVKTPTTETTDPLAPSSTPFTDLGVLVIEDNIINQQVLQRQLQKLGCTVTTADHGLDALRVLETSTWCLSPWTENSTTEQPKQRIDISIVLCDLEMPVMDGKTCVRRIRELQREGRLFPEIPILAVTGNARVPLEDARSWGFDGVVSKPFSVKSLVPLFQKMVTQKDLRGGSVPT